MYKAAFPYSSVEEEVIEKEFIKTLPATATEEIAGNVWVHPDQGRASKHVVRKQSADCSATALTLAKEYGIEHWILALLDPAPITHGTDSSEGPIQSPPPYRVKDMLNGSKSPKAEKKSVRGKRSVKSDSPAPEDANAKAARKIATPRKRKSKKEDGAADAPAVNGDSKADTVTVEVETTTAPKSTGADEETTTKVNIEMPAHSDKLKLPKDADGMLEKAREMVAEAEKLGAKSSGKGKRKAKDLTKDDVEDSLPAKKARVEVELRKEKIKRRALTGIAGTLVLG